MGQTAYWVDFSYSLPSRLAADLILAPMTARMTANGMMRNTVIIRAHEA